MQGCLGIKILFLLKFMHFEKARILMPNLSASLGKRDINY